MYNIDKDMKRLPKYRYSIITVCYNAENGIEKTVNSLLNQKFTDYEYIIKDGGSTDNTLNIINSLVEENEYTHIVSRKDKGIYDAMNEAVDMAKGDYVYFLNAGDTFYNDDVLYQVDKFICNNNYDFVYGNIVQIRGDSRQVKKYGKICNKKIFYLMGDCICHQATFARRNLFKEKKYDIKLKVCADKEWQMYYLSKHLKFVPVNFVIANFLVDGFSKEHIVDFEKETLTCIQKYYGNLLWLYKLLISSKHNSVVLKLLRLVEKLLFIRGII